MSYIAVQHLNYQYQIYQKKSGFKGSLHDLFHRQYTMKPVLKDISFSIPQGEVVGLLGPNGAGKSTLIKLLTGILHPQAGQIEVAGFQPDTDNPTFLNQIGVMMGQKSQLNWDLPARDTFNVLQSVHSIPREKFAQRLNHYLTMFKLKDVIDVPVRKLSLGERTKLEVIAALLHGPKLLILDEPTIGMDIVSQRSLYQFIKDVNEHDSVTILLISHQLVDIQAVTKRILILLDGQIRFDGTVEQLTDRAKLPTPEIIVSGDPIIATKNVQTTHENQKTIIQSYHDNSTITMNVKAIQDVHVQNPSLEDTIYQLFRNGDEHQ